jgi:multidrug efflux pump
MGGIVGRLLREFAVTLSVAIGVSMVVLAHRHSHDVRPPAERARIPRAPYQTVEDMFNWIVGLYGKTLGFVLNHAFVTLLVLLTTIGLNVYLFLRVPKGFFPQQDTGRMSGQIIADQDTSFQSMDKTLLQMVNIVAADPAVDTVNGFTGGGGGGGGGASTLNQGRMFISLKPLAERKITVDFIMQRLRPKLARVPGSTLFLQPSQDLRVGGRNSAALYQFTMRGDNLQDLITFAPQMFQQLTAIPLIVDVNSDQQNRGLQSQVVYDRDTAARFGISPQLIDNTLYDLFGQRQVSTMYKSLNQYHVVMEAAPRFWQNPETLRAFTCARPTASRFP